MLAQREPALSEDEVLSLAQQEGLTLMEAPGSSTGYKGVKKQTTTAGRFMARASGKHLGSFPSAHEAALAYARHIARCAPLRDNNTLVTAAGICDAERTAALDAMRTSANPTGYTGVSKEGSQTKPFKAIIPTSVRHDGGTGYIGCFASAEQAALAIVSRIGLGTAQTLRDAKRKRPYPSIDTQNGRSSPTRAEEEATRLGLVLVPGKGASGYSGVRQVARKRKQDSNGPCYAYLAYEQGYDHKQKVLGTASTAVDAALIVAKHKAQSSAEAAGQATNVALIGAQTSLMSGVASNTDHCSQEL